MAKLKVFGPCELSGFLPVSGAKNAALKILPAAILANSESHITNVPLIADIDKIAEILESIGAKITKDDNSYHIDPSEIHSTEPDQKLIKKLRGSIVVVGPLLAKFGKAVFSQPGGCLIGARPIDDHLDVFRQLKVNIHEDNGIYVFEGKPIAGEVTLSKMSVTATENAILATVLSVGTTKIHVAAAEPEIADLAEYLNKMGAKIKGAGTHEIEIEGVEALNGCNHAVLTDRIEAGTFVMAAVSTNSKVKIGPVIPEHLSLVLKKLRDIGANFDILEEGGQKFIETHKHNGITASNIDTRTYPGFPTDIQSPYAVLMTTAKGDSSIFETLFEGRFLYVDELKMMGAEINIESPHIIEISGPKQLKGHKIVCRDIRGGAALVIAGLIAEGETLIEDIEYIDRGYEKIDQKLNAAGANIERIND